MRGAEITHRAQSPTYQGIQQLGRLRQTRLIALFSERHTTCKTSGVMGDTKSWKVPDRFVLSKDCT